jgi:cytochrome b6-f complex iron-sulfur subunit
VPEESKPGAPKLSTKDILAAARAQAAKAGGAPAPAAPAEAPPAPSAEASPAPAATTEKGLAKPQATKKPGSTADILAAARAQAAQAQSAGAAPTTEAAPKAAPSAKPAAAKKPGSTADILAAARAAAGKGPAAAAPGAAAEKPAPKAKPQAPQTAATAEAPGEGPKLSVQEMLAAVRPGAAKEASAETAPAKPVKPAGAPPIPQKPVSSAARPVPPPDTTRRNILVALLLAPIAFVASLFSTAYAAAWTMLATTTGIATLATARFMLPNVLTEPPSKFKIGPPADFDLGTVATKLVAQYGVWIVHTDGYKGKNLIYALISVCTHLGCTPSWLEGERKFKCPCHGSGFYITGINFEGPAPRPLERAGIRLAEDGMLEVDKSVKFQEEMGQWNDPTSYYEVIG